MAAASIVVNGGNWFANIGTDKSKGTKILSICGDCAQPGIYEYPFGTDIQTILDDCGASDVLGVQIGGPSGTFISNKEFSRLLAFEDLATGGSFIVFNQQRNILDVVNTLTSNRFRARFIESSYDNFSQIIEYIIHLSIS